MMEFFRRVEPVRHLGPAGGGGSQSQVLGTEDGVRYVVKFKENSQGKRVLVNELIANGIARYLELPCPTGVIIEVSESFLNASKLTLPGKPVSSGLHFGTLDIMDGNYQRPPRSLIPGARNVDKFPSVLLFDILTMNHDRCNEGNFLIKPDGSVYDFYIVDQGHCFGQPNWDASIVAKVGTWNRNAFPEITQTIEGVEPFRGAIDKIKAMDDSLIAQIIEEVPDEWDLNTDERKALQAFILGQRNKIEDIILSHKDLFPKWK